MLIQRLPLELFFLDCYKNLIDRLVDLALQVRAFLLHSTYPSKKQAGNY